MWTFFMANEAKCLHKLQEDIENKTYSLRRKATGKKGVVSLVYNCKVSRHLSTM